MENNYNAENQKIFVEGYIDAMGCIPLSPRDLGILGFHVGDEIPTFVTDMGIIVAKQIPADVKIKEDVEIMQALLLSECMMLDIDVCQSKGLFRKRKAVFSPHYDDIVHCREQRYWLSYFVEKGQLTIPLTPEWIAADMRYIREVYEEGSVSVPAAIAKVLDLDGGVGYCIEDGVLYLSNDYENKISVDDWKKIQIPDEFERLYPRDIAQIEYLFDDSSAQNRIICKVLQ